MKTFNKRPFIILLTISTLIILGISVDPSNSLARADSLLSAEITNNGIIRIPYFQREVSYSSENAQLQEIVHDIPDEANIQSVIESQSSIESIVFNHLADVITEHKEILQEAMQLQEALQDEQESSTKYTFPTLDSFVASVSNGLSTITGVYVPGVMALRVVSQPSGGSSVTEQYGAASLYGKAKGVGNIGLLAHNYLSGGNFYNLRVGSQVVIVYGTGKVVNYIVTRIDSFQATNPNNYTKPFINLANGNKVKTSKIFNNMYRSGEVTFQTCIARDGSNTWGLIFVHAVRQ